jgi:hypothetical protein
MQLRELGHPAQRGDDSNQFPVPIIPSMIVNLVRALKEVNSNNSENHYRSTGSGVEEFRANPPAPFKNSPQIA